MLKKIQLLLTEKGKYKEKSVTATLFTILSAIECKMPFVVVVVVIAVGNPRMEDILLLVAPNRVLMALKAHLHPPTHTNREGL